MEKNNKREWLIRILIAVISLSLGLGSYAYGVHSKVLIHEQKINETEIWKTKIELKLNSMDEKLNDIRVMIAENKQDSMRKK